MWSGKRAAAGFGLIHCCVLTFALAEAPPRLVVQSGHTGAVEAVAFSPDGRLIASASSDNNVKLWDAERGRLLRTLSGHETQVYSVAFSADGATVAAGANGYLDGSIRIWDIQSGTLLNTLVDRGNKIALARHGKTLIAGGTQRILTVTALPSGQLVHKLQAHTDAIAAVAVSPDGKLAATGSDDKSAILWDVIAGKPLFTLSGHTERVAAVAFAAKGRQLVTGGNDKTLRVWDTASGKLVRVIDGQDAEIGSIAVAADGRTAIVAGFTSIRAWDLQTGKLLRSMSDANSTPQGKLVNGVAVSPDGKLAASAHFGIHFEDNTVQLWEIASGKMTRALTGHADSVNRVAWSPDGKQLAAAGWDGILNWWDLGGAGVRRDPGVGGTNAMAYAPDGKLLARSAQYDIKLHEPQRGKVLQLLTGHTDYVYALAWSRDSGLIATGSNDKTVRLWDAASGKTVQVLQGHKDDVRSVAFSPDGKLLASGSQDDTVRLWDVASGAHKATLPVHSWGNALAFTRDGNTLAVATFHDKVQLWDVAGARMTGTLEGHTGIVHDLSYSPDGKLLATGSADHDVRVWDAASGALLHRMTGHQGGVTSVQFSPNGKFLISGAKDNTMRLWRVRDGAHIGSLMAFTDRSWVVVDPAGRFDAADLEEMRGLHWVMPGDQKSAVPIELFMRDYYEPRLLPRLLKEEALPPLRALASLNRVQPAVEIAEIKPEAGGTVAVTVQVDGAKPAQGKASGVHDVKLFRNGQLVGSQDGALKLDAKGRARLSFTGIQLGQAPWDGKFDFSAYAFNADRVKSGTAHRVHTVDTSVAATPPKRRAYLVVIGVNAYDNPLLDLKFAANDAASIQQALEARLRSRRTFDEVVTVPLVSRQTMAAAGAVGAASKANIRAVLDLLAGRTLAPAVRANIPNADQLRKATPDDVVFLSFSGHGFYETGGDFYLLPTDIGPGKTRVPTDAVLAASISSQELTQWLRPVDGGEMALVIDACHSGAAVGENFKPGPMGSRGLGQLAFDKGMLVLAATQADNVALEAEELEHGYLSYALVQEGLLAKRADFKPQDGRVTLNEWLGYAAQRVPRLALEVDSGTFARGVKRKRSVGAGESAELADDVQQPSLFEFKRRAAGAELVVQ